MTLSAIAVKETDQPNPADTFFSHLSYPHPAAKQAFDIWADRYAQHDEQTGERTESSWHDTAARVADFVSKPTPSFRDRFFDMLYSMRFLPGGRVIGGAGLLNGKAATLSNCFMLGMQDSLESIYDTLKEAMQILSAGGGVGLNFSPLRPSGAILHRKRGHASGPLSYISVFNASGHTIEQGGSRRAAMMGQMHISHPEIQDFIHWKSRHMVPYGVYSAEAWEHFNVSVQVSDDFIEAVRKDRPWTMQHSEISRTVPARQLWDEMAEQAWESGDPGLFFLDRYQQRSNSGWYQKIIGSNPCGEVGLPEYGTCNLGSINVRAHLKTDSQGLKYIDVDGIYDTAYWGAWFLDNVLEVNYWPVEGARIENERSRRMGLGIMGLADALVECGIAYGTAEAQSTESKVMAIIKQAAYRASADMAAARGPFGAYDAAAFLSRPFIQQIREEDPGIYNQLLRKGARNVCMLAIAPTGTISQLAGVNSGMEPFFAHGWVRQDRVHQDGILVVPTPQYVTNPAFRVSYDLSPTEHAAMQAAAQRHVDQSISKTVNMPNSATVEDVQEVYNFALDQGLKGVTIFRDGCRGGVLNPLSREKVLEQMFERNMITADEYATQIAGQVCASGNCEA